VGAFTDAVSTGAMLVYKRQGDDWILEEKIVPENAIGQPFYGFSVSMGDGGNVVAMGGSQDNGNRGAAIVVDRSTGVQVCSYMFV
jgi:hypothetical protein